MDTAHRAPLSMDFPGKNTKVGCHLRLQGIFLTQRSNPCLLLGRWILYHLGYLGSPQIPVACSVLTTCNCRKHIFPASLAHKSPRMISIVIRDQSYCFFQSLRLVTAHQLFSSHTDCKVCCCASLSLI